MAYLYNESWQRLLEYLRSYKMGISKQRKWLEQFVSISEMFDYLARKLNRSFELIQTSLKEEIKVVTIIDSDYPKLLKEINDPPAILFLLGNDLNYDEKLTVSVIGSRYSTNYGERVARMIVESLKHKNRTIISGMAVGIDSIAQITALKSGMNSIAVLGSGVDVCYPQSQFRLYQDLINQGSIVSEYPPGTPARSYHFPARNRIISGLSSALIVAEAGLKSGTMITAEYAANQGRDVFAIPGSIFMKQSQGCHQLINDGAKIIVDQTSILSLSSEFGSTIPNSELKVLEIIHQFQPNYYELISLIKSETSELSILLGKLEALGYIELQFGKFCLTDHGMSLLV
ncbi:MAG: DNA-protecting protein DprA [Clostridiaceae bacterium]|jgi:DNA processing protein|nr:DNA-processing protein DprA [Bacillota bacterium]NLN51319.1 DNA-protecting protein DprA [Clostridiaceae bacterium]